MVDRSGPARVDKVSIRISRQEKDTRDDAWGGRLSDEELNSLVSFIRAGEPTAPAVAQPTQGGMMGGQGGGPPWMQGNQ